MKILTLAASLFLSSLSFAAFSYQPEVLKQSGASSLPFIETLILKNCPRAQYANLVGTAFEMQAQHRDQGVVYTVTYDLTSTAQPVKSALVVQSLWADDHGGITQPFRLLIDKMNVCN